MIIDLHKPPSTTTLIMKFVRLFSRQFRYPSIANPKSQKLPPISSSINNNNNIKELHGHLIRTHNHKDPNKIFLVLRNYSNSLSTLSKAQLIFDQIKKPQFIIWYYMIKAWSKSDDPIKTIYLYNNMRISGLNGNHLTIIFALKACGRVSDVLQGKRVHVNVVKIGYESYLFVSNALIYMYGFCGEMGFAQKVFDGMSERDLVSWNSLICGFSRCSMYDRVLSVFDSMQVAGVRADAVTLVKVVMACNVLSKWSVADDVVEYIERNCVDVDVYLGNTIIDMCGNRGLVELARRVFDRMSKKDLVSWNSLLKVCVKSGDLISARKLFNVMPIRDVISWTSLITGYSQADKYSDAVKCFQNMMTSEIKPNEVTIASVLSACAHLGMLDLGQEIHKFISQHKIIVDIYVGNTLIDMYCKCGDVQRALQVFLSMKEKDSVSWSAVISGLAVNGSANYAIQLFGEMLGENVMPTNGTFVGILLACSHAGLVDKGLEYFQSMQNVYGISPQMKHYGCVVDLLSRSGRLERAYEFILKMPIPADVVLWRILLSACKLHGNITLAETVSKKLLELDAGNSGNYVLISDTCASAEKWDSATMFRDLMGEKSVQKPSAWSSIEVQQQNNTPLP